MKIYLLALLGLAAGGGVKTISTSSTSDSRVAAPPDSSAPVAASSDTGHTASPTSSTPSSTSPTSSPASIGSIDSTIPDDIRDIPVSMTFAVEAIDDGSDKELFSNIKKSVTASLGGVLGTEVTVNKIAVVETAPAGRRLNPDVEQLQVTYTVKVGESFEAAAHHAIDEEIFHKDFANSMNKSKTPLEPGTTVKTVKMCTSTLPTVSHGTLTCTLPAIAGDAKKCTLSCTTTGYEPKAETAYMCNAKGKWEGEQTCGKKECQEETIPNGTLNCSNEGNLAGARNPCLLACNPNYKQKTAHLRKCNDTGTAWDASTLGACETVVCTVSGTEPSGDGATNASDLPADGTGKLNCSTATNASEGKLCTLECTAGSHYLEHASAKHCYGQNDTKGWHGFAGVCAKVGNDSCANKKAQDFCRQSATEIGKCDATKKCVSVATTVCATDSTVPCGLPNNISLNGNCASKKCIYAAPSDEPDVDLFGRSTFDVKDIDSTKVDKLIADLTASTKTSDSFVVDFNKDFIRAVSDSLGGVAVGDVTITKYELVSIPADDERRLNSNFLQGAPTRMLQVEYSVQVNQSDAADAKAALDNQSTFMYRSNST